MVVPWLAEELDAYASSRSSTIQVENTIWLTRNAASTNPSQRLDPKEHTTGLYSKDECRISGFCWQMALASVQSLAVEGNVESGPAQRHILDFSMLANAPSRDRQAVVVADTGHERSGR